jgi:glycerophosphoryl diester phosphodiesterase
MKSGNYTPEQLKLYCDKLYNTVMPLKPANALYIFSSFDERAILTMLELHPEAECMYITAKPLCDEVIEKVLSLGIRRVGATIHATSRDAMKKAHEANLVVNLWPGSCVEDFQLAYALGADIACSDVPVAVLDFVKNNMKWIKPMKDLK